MSGRFFTFQLSGYESYLAENIASSAQVLLLQENAVVGDGLSVVCAGGVGDQAVVVDRLLLVLLHPFYRDLLLDKDTTTIFLPDVSLKELTTDFFGVLMGYCETFVESHEPFKKEHALKSEALEIGCDDDHNLDEVTDDDILSIEFEDNEKKQFEKMNRLNDASPEGLICIDLDEHEEDNFDQQTEDILDVEINGEKQSCIEIPLNTETETVRTIKSTKSPLKRGQSTCPKCDKKYNNRSIPYRCECDHILGGTFISHQERPRMLKCPECEYRVCQRNAKSALKKHHDAIHANVTYDCKLCDYKSGYKQVLKKHVQSIHKGALYSCKECDYKNKFESGLFQHVQAVHRGVRYMCQFCGHQAIQTSALRKHEKVKHKEELEKLGNDKKSRSRFQVLTDSSA